ncbi:hypothetical protein HYH03_018551 [Edaphochlamys debaryana]|uniref:F-box domain-containing protein n=1 Tax=Edaphochlamys debaryana TaxID=47281 RepID=A0A835XF14_9CHLO|nr:hypothetical protein HYH03_018551 [Edaphochlamys debaryana]|eukprot:KAG2482506.1 hypothetical protein HYH03_018551 [Edaphochlamys debaryana]
MAVLSRPELVSRIVKTLPSGHFASRDARRSLRQSCREVRDAYDKGLSGLDLRFGSFDATGTQALALVAGLRRRGCRPRHIYLDLGSLPGSRQRVAAQVLATLASPDDAASAATSPGLPTDTCVIQARTLSPDLTRALITTMPNLRQLTLMPETFGSMDHSTANALATLLGAGSGPASPASPPLLPHLDTLILVGLPTVRKRLASALAAATQLTTLDMWFRNEDEDEVEKSLRRLAPVRSLRRLKIHAITNAPTSALALLTSITSLEVMRGAENVLTAAHVGRGLTRLANLSMQDTSLDVRALVALSGLTFASFEALRGPGAEAGRDSDDETEETEDEEEEEEEDEVEEEEGEGEAAEEGGAADEVEEEEGEEEEDEEEQAGEQQEQPGEAAGQAGAQPLPPAGRSAADPGCWALPPLLETLQLYECPPPALLAALRPGPGFRKVHIPLPELKLSVRRAPYDFASALPPPEAAALTGAVRFLGRWDQLTWLHVSLGDDWRGHAVLGPHGPWLTALAEAAPRLRTLVLEGVVLGEPDVEPWVGGMQALADLRLIDPSALSPPAYQLLPRLPSLERLVLGALGLCNLIPHRTPSPALEQWAHGPAAGVLALGGMLAGTPWRGRIEVAASTWVHLPVDYVRRQLASVGLVADIVEFEAGAREDDHIERVLAEARAGAGTGA